MKLLVISSLYLLVIPNAFSFTRLQISTSTCSKRGVLHATPAIEWKPFAQPRFDEFASCTVGPWTTMSQSTSDATSKYEVEEVMRSCGGAVQGITEIPLHLVYSDLCEDEAELRIYHNRADGGFVYINDGSYSAGPEQFDFDKKIGTFDTSNLFMASLSIAKQRLWLSSSIDSIYESHKQCGKDSSVVSVHDASFVALSRPSSDFLSDNHMKSHADQVHVLWKSALRVRMPNPTQSWSLARAKWETTALNKHENGDIQRKVEIPTKGFAGLTEVEVISSKTSTTIFDDLVEEGVMIRMIALCPQSTLARSVVRCYDTEGQLKSVAFLEGVF